MANIVGSVKARIARVLRGRVTPPPVASDLLPPEDMPQPKRRSPRIAKRKLRLRARGSMRFLQWLVASAFLGFIFSVLAFALVIQHYSSSLPSTDQLANYDPAIVTRLYADDGKLMAEYAKEKRFFLPLSAIPKAVQRAFIAAEDKNFYSHQGIDLMGTARAIRANLLHYGKNHTLVGGSTITQQVVKNFLLTSEKSFERKIKEAILAYRISNSYSKEKILELYLNEIYLGQGTYGVAAAAITYFDKSLDELSTEEAALLAALPKAPSYFDPAKNYNRALERRNYVIGRMLADGYIDAHEAARAKSTAIITRTRNKDEVAHADFFAEEVRRTLVEMYGSEVLYKGGLFVKTTLNPKFQDYADHALREALMLYDQRHGYRGPIASLKQVPEDWPAALNKVREEKNVALFDDQQLAIVRAVHPKVEIGLLNGDRGILPPEQMRWAKPTFAIGDVVLVAPAEEGKQDYKLLQIPEINGGLVVMDAHTGRVLAMSGGYAYTGSEFNRVTQAKRQPGSAFKPFVYLTALESGFSPTSIIQDSPISLPQGPDLPMWTPKNYEGDYLGPITFRKALEHSRNAVTVRLAAMIGIKRVMRVARRLGIYDDDGSLPNYSMVLGARETTLMRLTAAYSMIANGGRRIAPWLIERIDDRNGATIFRRDTRQCEACMVSADAESASLSTPPTIPDERDRVIDPRVAYQLTSILEGVVQRGTGGAARVLHRTVAGKTGTTNDARDTWFMGFTPDIVVGTYIGFDTPKSLGSRETGGRVAIQGFIKFMQQAAGDIPKHDFRVPPGIREISVDRETGSVLMAGVEPGRPTIREAFLTGGPIFKPQNELQEELKEKESGELPLLLPEMLNNPEGPPLPPNPFTPPGAGELAPYQRPIDPDGFNPGGGVSGTGGVY